MAASIAAENCGGIRKLGNAGLVNLNLSVLLNEQIILEVHT